MSEEKNRKRGAVRISNSVGVTINRVYSEGGDYSVYVEETSDLKVSDITSVGQESAVVASNVKDANFGDIIFVDEASHVSIAKNIQNINALFDIYNPDIVDDLKEVTEELDGVINSGKVTREHLKPLFDRLEKNVSDFAIQVSAGIATGVLLPHLNTLVESIKNIL